MAAAMVGNDVLPEDVMLSILSRLPVKTLKRFSCVCKSWFATFQNPDFIRNHYNVSGSNLKIIVQTMNSKIYDYYLSSEPTMEIRERIDFSSSIQNFDTRRMVGDCEGLICLYNPFTANSVALFNPATRQLKALPQSCINGSRIRRSVYVLGLGFDSKTNDYKVVRFVSHFHGGETYVELYYLSSNSWKRIHFPSEFEEQYPRRMQWISNVYLKGCCHWFNYGTKAILAFDMSLEVFHTMPLPAHLLLHKFTSSTRWPSLRVFDSHLALVLTPNDVRDCFEIHVMKEYGVTESWTKQFVLGPIPGIDNILGYWRSGDQWFFSTCDMSTLSHQVKVYDTSTKVVKDLPIYRSSCRPEVVIFTEKLYPLLEDRVEEVRV